MIDPASGLAFSLYENKMLVETLRAASWAEATETLAPAILFLHEKTLHH
jgi:hypothetical protein